MIASLVQLNLKRIKTNEYENYKNTRINDKNGTIW